MNLAVLIQPGYPTGKIRRFVSTLKPDTAVYLPTTGAEHRIAALAARSRGLVVREVPEPGHAPIEGLAVLRGHGTIVPAEVKARLKGLPVAVLATRIWDGSG